MRGLAVFCFFVFVAEVSGQTAVKRPEEKQKEEHAVAKAQEKTAQNATSIEFQGQRAFKEKELRSQLKEQIATVEKYGLTPARANDLAFFLEIFYRKRGYLNVNVQYKMES